VHVITRCFARPSFTSHGSVSVVLNSPSTGDLTTEVLLFSYLPPTIDMVLPSTMDADGQSIVVRGSNFGREVDTVKWTAQEALVAVVVGGVNCSAVQRVTRTNRPALECAMQRQTVGFKNVSIMVATQFGFMSDETQALIAMCSRNNYGNWSEVVRGGVCGGGGGVGV
jgi:hypothetical protein